MKEFFKILRIYVAPYKGNFIWSIILTIFSAIFNIFSFALLIPILQILFGIDQADYSFIPWDSAMSIKEIATNNMYWFVKEVMIADLGGSTTLLLLGVFMLTITAIKTATTDHIVAARKCNYYIFSDIPRGKYNPSHGLDMETTASKRDTKVKVQ